MTIKGTKKHARKRHRQSLERRMRNRSVRSRVRRQMRLMRIAIAEGDADKVIIRANSDAAIVSGLIALLTQVYSGCRAQQIIETEPYFIREIGLHDHLSPTRANGLHAMLNAIRGHALEVLGQA